MHEFDNTSQRIRVGFGQDAVTQVEDVTLGLSTGLEDTTYGVIERVRGCEQQRWVEIALNREVGSESSYRIGKIDAEIHTDDVAPGRRHRPEQLTGTDAEMNHRHTQITDAIEARA